MRYIPSQQAQKLRVPYEDLGEQSWMVSYGYLDKIIGKYGSAEIGAALDVGCGSGFTCAALGRSFSRVSCADLTDHRFDRLKSGSEFASFDLNFDVWPYEDGAFDMVTALQVIEHLENPFLIMREARRVLRPGGLFVISMPNPYNIAFRIKFLLAGNMRPWNTSNDHLLFMTRDVFAKTYLADFDVLEKYYQRGEIPFSGKLRWLRGKKAGKNIKILPPSERFSVRIGYVLKKK